MIITALRQEQLHVFLVLVTITTTHHSLLVLTNTIKHSVHSEKERERESVCVRERV